jgi:methylmalonyl-CoA mutase N-terminal domain/subunit
VSVAVRSESGLPVQVVHGADALDGFDAQAVQLTAQQPEVNLVRVALQALAAVLGGTQSLHTNSCDEAIALPIQKTARPAPRTQQVIAYETDVTKTVDLFAGSYAIESMTGELEAAALAPIQAVVDRGGAVAAIEQGFQKAEIEAAAHRVAEEIDSGARTVVGVNILTGGDEAPIFEIADLGIVGDLFTVVPQLLDEVGKRKQL